MVGRQKALTKLSFSRSLVVAGDLKLGISKQRATQDVSGLEPGHEDQHQSGNDVLLLLGQRVFRLISPVGESSLIEQCCSAICSR